MGQSYAEDDGVDHDEYDPRPGGSLDAEKGDDDGEQVDGRYGETPDQEEAHRGGVLGLVQQPIVSHRVPLYGRQ